MNLTQLTQRLSLIGIAVLIAFLATTTASARPFGPGDNDGVKPGETKNEPAAAPAPTTTPSPIEEQLLKQSAILEQMQNLLVKQQAEIATLRSELDAMKASKPAATDSTAAVPASAGGAANGTTASVATTDASASAPTNASAAPTAASTDDDVLGKRLDVLEKQLGKIYFNGDVRFRSESFWNQGFDAPTDVAARNRFRIRARLNLVGKMDNHFDWGLRLSTGTLNDPISSNQTLDNFYNRKTFAVDRGYLHYTTDSKPANFDVWAGKFDYTWKRTSLTWDNDVQPEGLSERVKWSPKDGYLKGVTFTAWQLPMKERAVDADAYVYGGQVLTEWKWNDNWSSNLAGTFQDYEQVQIIPQFTLVSATLVNAGFDYATTNAVIINPFTNLPELRSNFRVSDVLGDVTYRGFGSKWPLLLQAEWIHNGAAYNNQRDGGFATIQIGQRKEKGDMYFDYAFFKIERDATPSVFVESDILQTNSVDNWFTASYMIRKNIEFSTRYFVYRRLDTTSPVNRWLNRLQIDMIYSF